MENSIMVNIGMIVSLAGLVVLTIGDLLVKFPKGFFWLLYTLSAFSIVRKAVEYNRSLPLPEVTGIYPLLIGIGVGLLLIAACTHFTKEI